MAAGGSAGETARRAREYALELSRRAGAAYAAAGRYAAAAAAERAVAAVLIALTGAGWRLLVDRRWPGTASANVDMILVGPGGVYVIDVKRWRDAPSAADGHLLAGTERRDAEIGKLLAQAAAVERAVGTLGISPVAVRPIMIFTGHRIDSALGRVRLLDEGTIVRTLVAEPRRFMPAMVRAVATCLEEEFPAYDVPALDDTRPASPGPAAPLFEVDDVVAAAVRGALAEPIETWMTFLHPEQAALTRRHWNGPARVRGPAGTGKTVVGLHRAAHLAARGADRLLFLTFSSSLPRVQGRLFARMAPAEAARVEFANLHAWALRFLRARGVPVRLDPRRAADAYARAWRMAGQDSVLSELEANPSYWREEIDQVVKGRGLATLGAYRTVERHGRRTPLQLVHREAAWLLYEEYELLRADAGVHDYSDVLLAALAELRARPERYAAVIVDEVQDLTLTGVRIAHALAGDGPDGLLLIGDGQQSVYPGGFRLADAGVDVRGRGAVLRTNYRNAARIMEAAFAVVSGDPFDDLEEASADGRRDVEPTHHGGIVLTEVAPDAATHDAWLVRAVREHAPDPGGAAVLCRTRRECDYYARLLTRAGVRVTRLEQYDGHPGPEVKMGTYVRAKGLEFKYVFLPRLDLAVAEPEGGPSAEERGALRRRQVFVGMTRARDLLWQGTVAP